jgi:hypothetical protein
MGIFNTILSQLGFGDDKKEGDSAKSLPPAEQAVTQEKPELQSGIPAAQQMTSVDVVSKLEQMASHQEEKLDWQSSIVDLMKLLGLESSLAARKELATELGCPASKMGDSAQMNIWLHKTVLQKLAENGGNIPANLLQ